MGTAATIQRLSRASRRGHQVGVATVITVVLLAGAFGVIFWRYEHAQAQARVALLERGDRLRVERAVAVFWHQREAINEFLITRKPAVLSEIRRLQRDFVASTGDVGTPAEANFVGQARGADQRLFAEFDVRRDLARGPGGQAAIEVLHPFENAVLRPLRALNRFDVGKERAGIAAAASASGQAQLVAIFGGLLAVLAGLAFAAYVAKLLRHVTLQASVLEQTLQDREDAHATLQDKESQLRQAQKMEAVGRLAGGVAHDFNNMLLAITGYGDLALADIQPEQARVRHGLEQIRLASDRAAGLTAQLLAFSRQQVLQTRVVEINELVEGLAGMLRPLLGETVELRLELAKSVGALEADPGQLEQVVTNLVVNARDAMPHGGPVTITTATATLSELPSSLSEGSYVVLTVADSGEGMDDETLARALEPFFTTKELGKGTGLGLATVHGIVVQSGGDVRIASTPGEGTSIAVYLPSTHAAPDAIAVESASDVLCGTETILLVEDDRVVQSLLADVLTRNGYDVVTGGDAAEAVATAVSRGNSGDLLLTDMVMPGMSGRELVERLRLLDPQLRALYMSGYTQDADLYEEAEEGRIDFLQKPFSPAVLLQAVRVALDRSPEVGPERVLNSAA
ncbi:MAG: two-component system, cell cycle sensor histidine kinase and response regulator CckA [Gaiellaceae bacterium]|nr:two-component system, cell cycle sensor histidine kinase and response regulator CckA [Gaiellaceae bacterium]